VIVVQTRHDSDEIRVLDDKGCLTVEVMCFTDELPVAQRAVVDRHIHHCTICAQQQTAIATAAERLRRARPRILAPADIKVLAREGALRSLAVRRKRSLSGMHRIARLALRASASGKRPWYHTLTFKVALLSVMAAAVIIAIAALLLLVL